MPSLQLSSHESPRQGRQCQIEGHRAELHPLFSCKTEKGDTPRLRTPRGPQPTATLYPSLAQGQEGMTTQRPWKTQKKASRLLPGPLKVPAAYPRGEGVLS